MRQSWTDDRLDDLSHRMGQRFDQVEAQMQVGFARVDGEIKELRREVKAGQDELRGEIKAQGDELRGEIKELGEELRGEMAAMEARLRAQASEHYLRTGEELVKIREASHRDKQELLAEMQALQRTLIQIGWTAVIALVVALAGVLITHL